MNLRDPCKCFTRFKFYRKSTGKLKIKKLKKEIKYIFRLFLGALHVNTNRTDNRIVSFYNAKSDPNSELKFYLWNR